MGGWEEKLRVRLNSAQLKLKLLVGAELGKSKVLKYQAYYKNIVFTMQNIAN